MFSQDFTMNFLAVISYKQVVLSLQHLSAVGLNANNQNELRIQVKRV